MVPPPQQQLQQHQHQHHHKTPQHSKVTLLMLRLREMAVLEMSRYCCSVAFHALSIPHRLTPVINAVTRNLPAALLSQPASKRQRTGPASAKDTTPQQGLLHHCPKVLTRPVVTQVKQHKDYSSHDIHISLSMATFDTH